MKIVCAIVFLFVFVQNSFSASLYGFTKDGTQKWSVTVGDGTDPAIGGIDYIGNGYILLANDDLIGLIYLDGSSASFVKTFHTFPTGEEEESGSSIAANHTMFFEGNGEPRFDGIQAYIGRDRLEEGFIVSEIVFFDIGSGTIIEITIGSGTLGAEGLAWDGMALWYSESAGAEDVNLNRLEVGLAQPVITKSYSFFTTFDMAFDGKDLWALDSSVDPVVVKQFEAENFSTELQSWSTGLTNPKGLTTDGQQIIIMAD